jgi:hypothetical protein
MRRASEGIGRRNQMEAGIGPAIRRASARVWSRVGRRLRGGKGSIGTEIVDWLAVGRVVVYSVLLLHLPPSCFTRFAPSVSRPSRALRPVHSVGPHVSPLQPASHALPILPRRLTTSSRPCRPELAGEATSDCQRGPFRCCALLNTQGRQAISSDERQRSMKLQQGRT